MADGPELRVDWLRSFACFAEHLNFTRAAKVLHLSQPALHVQIARLSSELGVPLYSKRGRTLVLTPQGSRLLAFARDADLRAKTFVAELQGAPVDHPVVLASGEGAYLYLLSDALKAFRKRSRSPLSLLTRDQAGTLEAVRNGDADLGVAALESAPQDISLVIERLCDIDQVVVMPRSHPLAKKRAVQLVDLQGTALVVPKAGRPHRAMLARALESAGVRWEVAVEANGWELIVHFATLGLGLAVVNAFCRIPAGMVARPVRGLPSVRYSIFGRRNAFRSTATEMLRALIVEKASDVRARP